MRCVNGFNIWRRNDYKASHPSAVRPVHQRLPLSISICLVATSSTTSRITKRLVENKLMRRRKGSSRKPEWQLKRIPVTVEYEGTTYKLFPVIAKDGTPVLFSRTIRTGCFTTLMPSYHHLLWDLIELCEENEDPNVILGVIHQACQEAIDDRWNTYYFQLGAEPRRRQVKTEENQREPM